jgi:replicative DNA helicase
MSTSPASPPKSSSPKKSAGNGAPAGAGRPPAATAALERMLPESREGERALLGCMLLSKEAIGEAQTVLRDAGRDVFTSDAHRHLFDVLVDFYLRPDTPIDGVLIKEELTRRGQWESIGGYDLLGGLLTAVPSATRVRHYAEVVYEKHLLRQLIAAVHRVLEQAFDADLPARETLDFAEKAIFEVTEKRVSGEAQPLGELLHEVARLFERHGDDVLTGEPTDFYELDEMTCGLQPGELIIVAGRPSMGKTAFGLNVAENLAIGHGLPVLFFSLEMSKQQVAQRVLCSRSRVDNHRLRRGRISRDELERLKDVANDLSSAPLLVDDTSDLSILELRARARMIHRRLRERKQRLHAIFVDYLQLMHVPRSENRQHEVATISRGLKALAKDLNVPVVAMAQLNRNPEDKMRKGNRPRMSDLRESGAIEQDADVVMLLHRESYYRMGEPARAGGDSPGGRYSDADGAGGLPAGQAGGDPVDDNTAELIVAKQRNGPVGTITLHFNRQWTRFDNHKPAGEPAFVPRMAREESPF